MEEKFYELTVGFYASGGIVTEFSNKFDNIISHQLRIRRKFRHLSNDDRFKFFEIRLIGSYSKIEVPCIHYEYQSLNIYVYLPFDVLRYCAESTEDSVCVLSAGFSLDGGFKDSGFIDLEEAKLYHDQPPGEWEYEIGEAQKRSQ